MDNILSDYHHALQFYCDVFLSTFDIFFEELFITIKI